MDPSQFANPIVLALSVPAYLMTCRRLMNRAAQGQSRYLLCPATMTVRTCPWSSGWYLSFFLSPTLPLLNDGMGNEKWGLILKYQFPGWSRIIYRLSVSVVILQRFWFTIGKYISRACFLWDFEFIFGLRIVISTVLLLLTWPCS